jgi:hypothetical protein
MTATRRFAQQARRDRERRERQSTNFRVLAQRARRNQQLHSPELPQIVVQQTTNTRSLAQQTRQNREHEPIARQPLLPQLPGTTTVSLCHRLGLCDILCHFCGANHWIQERVQRSAKYAPQFATCCENGAIMMERFQDPPQPLFSLLTDITLGTFLYHH